jgi:hypothetical protein
LPEYHPVRQAKRGTHQQHGVTKEKMIHGIVSETRLNVVASLSLYDRARFRSDENVVARFQRAATGTADSRTVI